MQISTADISDANPERVKAAQLSFLHFGKKKGCFGKIVTLKLFEDNSFVRQALEESGKGKMLVIDAGGSMRCAVLGDQLATLAMKNEWEGVLVFGCIRDSRAINEMNVCIKALGTHPLKTAKRNEGQKGIPVQFGAVTFWPDEYVYADEDGVLVSNENVIA